MADTAVAQPSMIPAELTDLYEQLKALLLPDAQTSAYTPKTRNELKAGLQEVLLPNLQEAIRQRQATTRKSNAAVDADAAARGLGPSTWGTDVKKRSATTEAQDIASMQGAYNSSLASNLANLLNDQESKKMAADQSNQSAKANAKANALQIALSNYDNWGSSDPVVEESKSRRSGGGGSKSSTSSTWEPANPADYKDYSSYMQAADPYAYTRSYDEKLKASDSMNRKAIIQNYNAKKSTSMSKTLKR